MAYKGLLQSLSSGFSGLFFVKMKQTSDIVDHTHLVA